MLALVVLIASTTYLNSQPDQLEKKVLTELSLEEDAAEDLNETDLNILPFETQNQPREIVKSTLKSTNLPSLKFARLNHPGIEVPPPETKLI